MNKNSYNLLEEILRHLSFVIKIEGRKALNLYPEISKTMFEVIQIIYFSREIKGTTLSELLEISKPAASELLRKLVTFNYVKKESNPKDKREVIYTLTDKGKEVINKVIEKRVLFLKKIIKKEELKILLPHLEKVINKIKNMKNCNQCKKTQIKK